MNFFEMVNRRESCRIYQDKPVEKEKLMKCVEAARLAPSACNSQPWSFKVINNRELITKLAPYFQERAMNKFAGDCPSFIVICEEKATLSARISDALDSQHYAGMDIGIATSHLFFAATEQGLSTCILGWFDEDKIKAELDIPEEKKVRLVLAVGYAASDSVRDKKRKPLEEIVEFID